MYLKQIKLAGFKSFVDPTVIPIRSSLSAIVGPNGCGKSNIVDAIRWVIGETSAKQLRGQSMSDVIFNGTASRQPLGRAMVELLFDNSEHRLTGEYAAYTEICIRREVEREGQSNYYLNGTKCRRKDIVDIFLGTGLGPRSYSIIEQGMISRLIEAKPEELRAFVEEAAGVSKYKERRRETQNRIKHTEDNLSRVDDLCDELGRQLNRLQRQAKSAEKYKIYKQQEDEMQLQLKGLHWQQLNTDLQQSDQSLSSFKTEFEQARTEAQQIETDLDHLRVEQGELSQQQAEAQKTYYSARADVSKLEERINHLQQQAQQWRDELESTGELWRELSDSTDQHELDQAELAADVGSLSPQLVEYKQRVDQYQEMLQGAEQEQQHWQSAWDEFQVELSKTHKQVEVEKNNLEHLQRQQSRLQEKLMGLQSDHGAIDLNGLQESIDQLNEETNATGEQIAAYEAEMATSSEQISALRDTISQQAQNLDADREQLQTLKGRQASLEALQQAALRDDDAKLSGWLADQGLNDAKRLGESIQVESGWETAAETVLFDCFKAVCVDSTMDHINAMAALSDVNVAFVTGSATSGTAKADTLAAKVKANCHLPVDLSQIYVAETVEQARAQLAQCESHQSVITSAGVWMGRDWIKLFHADDAKRGVLQREQHLKDLQSELDTLMARIDEAECALADQRQQLQGLEAARDEMQQVYQQASHQLSQQKSELSSIKAQYQSRMQRLAQLADDIEQTSTQLETVSASVAETEANITVSSQSETELHQKREELVAKRDQKREVVIDTREQLQLARQTADELTVRLATSENQLSLLQQSLEQDRRQMQQLGMRKQQLQEQLSDDQSPLEQLQEQLQAALLQSTEGEQNLSGVQQKIDEVHTKIQALDSNRHKLNQAVQNQQQQLQQMQMDRQTLVVKQASIVEQLAETDHTIEAILPTIPEDASIAVWADELITLEKRISRLGPINLAAIEEYDEVNERKTYLDEQQRDLREALDTLGAAIRKIDKETRDNFRQTFETINTHFKSIFPKVFNGGRAEMVLTDDDLLTTGISVRAQPPGKRNSTIHMLSGGEKALTAIALVFSLFQLNPAPFCILDEVDAPLDDLNVGRYCALIREMVGQTQFLVISHNKVTIEAADSLLGVTQQEPGVSRMVAVDIEQAVAMAEA